MNKAATEVMPSTVDSHSDEHEKHSEGGVASSPTSELNPNPQPPSPVRASIRKDKDFLLKQSTASLLMLLPPPSSSHNHNTRTNVTTLTSSTYRVDMMRNKDFVYPNVMKGQSSTIVHADWDTLASSLFIS